MSIADTVRHLKRDHERTIVNIQLNVPLAGTSTSRNKPHYPEHISNPMIREGFKRKIKERKGEGSCECRQITKAAAKIALEVGKEMNRGDAQEKRGKSRGTEKTTKMDRKNRTLPKVKVSRKDSCEVSGSKRKRINEDDCLKAKPPTKKRKVSTEQIVKLNEDSDMLDDIRAVFTMKISLLKMRTQYDQKTPFKK
ncbi:hypothetical protein QAD02_021836 [Eretmocerus hayati]|uniref:Uncharacterized protein n=1 Tax=Eretmocerus hayati TaxID=131215 RepID=A0ACC2PSF8_9HYME|nr:hypothetical protein QAD02_021836 [Eretmocerus hayati]